MREPNWKSYIVVEPEPILSPQQCQEFIRLGQAEPLSDGDIMVAGHRDKTDYTARKNKVSHIPFDKAPKIYSDLLGWMHLVNRNRFGFEGMEMHETGQYSEYSKGDFYTWHIDLGVDAIPVPPVRKISLSLLLNDPKEFEGGELEIFGRNFSYDPNNNFVFKLKQGQALFFASFHVHRVKPITSGNRKSLVMWFGGMPFK
jgi:PKHD-type hydroxylase|tara:strand:+ start:95 stop:694 length:600 start_codon:yes stop_codon:yes gene_type:complete